MRVYLGIYRSLALPPSQWLGFPVYKDLAAALLVPSAPTRSVWSLSDPEPPSHAQAFSLPKAPTMSSALAAAFYEAVKAKKAKDDRHAPELKFLGVFPLIATEENLLPGFYIEYSARQDLAKAAIAPKDFSHDSFPEIDSANLEGKVVLIGDVRNAKKPDIFNDPATNEPIPGVVVHASATNTLIGSPLYSFPIKGEFKLDLIFGFCILAVVIFVRLVYLERVNEGKLVILANFGAAALVLLFGWFVNYTRVMWPDFLLLSIGIMLHPSAHKQFEKSKDRFFRRIQQPEVRSR